jgi:hypothetical protein
MNVLAIIYIILGLIWAAGVHIWAVKKFGVDRVFPPKKRFVYGLIGTLYNVLLWPVAAANIVYRTKKGLPISITHPL